MFSMEYDSDHVDCGSTEEEVIEALHTIGVPAVGPDWFEHLYPDDRPLEDLISSIEVGSYLVIPITDTLDLTVHH